MQREGTCALAPLPVLVTNPSPAPHLIANPKSARNAWICIVFISASVKKADTTRSPIPSPTS